MSSGPEKTFEHFLVKFPFLKDLIDNRPKSLYLSQNKLKLIVIMEDRKPWIDNKRINHGKAFWKMQPDFFYLNHSGEVQYYLEIKDNGSHDTWRGLSNNIHHFNDQIRFSLLRNRFKAINLELLKFQELTREEKQTIKRKDKNNDNIRYVRLLDIKTQIKRPSDNFINDFLPNTKLPVKRLDILPNRLRTTLYLVDKEIMKRWEKGSSNNFFIRKQ